MVVLWGLLKNYLVFLDRAVVAIREQLPVGVLHKSYYQKFCRKILYHKNAILYQKNVNQLWFFNRSHLSHIGTYLG